MTPSSSNGNDSKADFTFTYVCTVCQNVYKSLKQKHEIGFPIRVKDWLIPEISRLAVVDGAKFSVERHPRFWDTYRLNGYLERYPDRAIIAYSLALNTCWRRFVVTKELSHLMLDDDTSFTKDPVELVQGLVNAMANLEAGRDLQSEHLSVAAAAELLLPWCLRPQLEKMEADGQTHLQIATVCRVPLKLVTLMLSAPYKVQSGTTNRKIEG
jgi:hypothetical protein